jgi:hypothetical protein
MRRWEVGRPSALEVYGRLMEEGRPLRYEDGRQNGKEYVSSLGNFLVSSKISMALSKALR